MQPEFSSPQGEPSSQQRMFWHRTGSMQAARQARQLSRWHPCTPTHQQSGCRCNHSSRLPGSMACQKRTAYLCNSPRQLQWLQQCLRRLRQLWRRRSASRLPARTAAGACAPLLPQPAPQGTPPHEADSQWSGLHMYKCKQDFGAAECFCPSLPCKLTSQMLFSVLKQHCGNITPSTTESIWAEEQHQLRPAQTRLPSSHCQGANTKRPPRQP